MDALYLDKAHPELYASLKATAAAATQAARDAGLSARLVELVSLRVSEINGCAFCLDVHHAKAVRAGETEQRLALLSAWRETDLFDELEHAALELAEAVTTLPHAEERLAIEYRVREILSDAEFAAVAWIAISMNSMNRLSIISRHPVRPKA